MNCAHRDRLDHFCFECFRERREVERKQLVVELTAALGAGRIVLEANGPSSIEWRLRDGVCETRHNARDWSRAWGHDGITPAEIAEHLSNRTGMGMRHTVSDTELPPADRTDHDPVLQEHARQLREANPEKTFVVEEGAVWIREADKDYAVVSRVITGEYVKTFDDTFCYLTRPRS
jgi:hypothetical protein